MGGANPTFEVDLGTPVPLRWPVDRAILCVYLYPGSRDLHRAVWQLESDTGVKFGVAFAEPADGGAHFPADGQAVAAALQALPGFDEVAFAAAQAAVTAPTDGRYVCWQRTPTDVSPAP